MGEVEGHVSLQHLLQVRKLQAYHPFPTLLRQEMQLSVTKGNMTQFKNWIYGICFLAKRTTIQLLLELSGKYILLLSLELLLLLKIC